jgi:hypothetical protein
MRWRNPLVGLCAAIAVCGVAQVEDLSEPQTGEVIYGYACSAGTNSKLDLLNLRTWSAITGAPEGCAVVDDPRPWPYAGQPALKCIWSVEPPKGCAFSAELSAAFQAATAPPPAPSVAPPPVATLPATPPAAPTAVAEAEPTDKPAKPTHVPEACPFGNHFGGWMIGLSVDGKTPVVTPAKSWQYGGGEGSLWSASMERVELIPLKDGGWVYLLPIRELKNADQSVTEIKSPYAIAMWDKNKKVLVDMERKDGGGTFYHAPYVMIGLPAWFIDDEVAHMEAAGQISISLSMPKGDGYKDVAWVTIDDSSGLSSMREAGKKCAIQ